MNLQVHVNSCIFMIQFYCYCILIYLNLIVLKNVTCIDSRIHMTCTLLKNSKQGKTQIIRYIIIIYQKKKLKIQKSGSRKVKEPLDLLILQSETGQNPNRSKCRLNLKCQICRLYLKCQILVGCTLNVRFQQVVP